MFQHRVHLFSIGLEYNAGAGTDLPAGQEALDKYYSNFYSLNPVEERGVPNTEYSDLNQRCTKVVGGVCAVIGDDSVRLTTLGSTSRGIPRKEWEIPLPVVDPVDYTLCPDANVIAFVKLQGMM